MQFTLQERSGWVWPQFKSFYCSMGIDLGAKLNSNLNCPSFRRENEKCGISGDEKVITGQTRVNCFYIIQRTHAWNIVQDIALLSVQY